MPVRGGSQPTLNLLRVILLKPGVLTKQVKIDGGQRSDNRTRPVSTAVDRVEDKLSNLNRTFVGQEAGGRNRQPTDRHDVRPHPQPKLRVSGARPDCTVYGLKPCIRDQMTTLWLLLLELAASVEPN